MIQYLRAFSVVVGAVASVNAFAQGISQPSESELKNPSTTTGLCTSDNEKSMFYENYCLAIKEQFDQQCTKDLIEKLRKRFIGEQPAQDTRGFDANLNCENFREAAKSQDKFENILLQLFASVSAAESAQREYAGLERAAQASNEGKKGGLFGLTDEIINDEKFSCGCQNRNSKGDGKNLTVNDGHLQATCATYVALYWAEKHGKLFGGIQKDSSKNCRHGVTELQLETNEPHGAACIFKSLQDIEPPPGQTQPQRRQPGQHQSMFNAPDLRMVDSKVANYCKANIDSRGNFRNGVFTLPAGSGTPRGVPATP